MPARLTFRPVKRAGFDRGHFNALFQEKLAATIKEVLDRDLSLEAVTGHIVTVRPQGRNVTVSIDPKPPEEVEERISEIVRDAVRMTVVDMKTVLDRVRDSVGD